MGDDFNLNLLDHGVSSKVKDYLNLTFQNFLIPVINKPTRITKTNATLIDHILTNNFFNSNSFTGIVKTDISDHFPIFLLTSEQVCNNSQKKTTIRKREITEKSKQYFAELLNEVNWKQLYTLYDPNLAYEFFLRTFSALYDHAFPLKEVRVKVKTVMNPWMTKGLQKSSKKKQKLYEKFLKNRTNENEKKYKNYKSLFEILKEKCKKIYYSRRLTSCGKNMKKAWDTIKEVIGKTKSYKNEIPKRMMINGIETFDQNKIANGFNKFFTEIGPKLANSIPDSSKNFKDFMNISETTLQESVLQDEELQEAFDSLKSNKSPGFDEISSSIVTSCSASIFSPLKHIFNLSLQKGIFPNSMKVARVSPIFKKDEEFLFTNYRPISVLPCFSKLLERLMYNRLYNYLLEHNLLYEKQFGFQASNSTEHAVIQLVDQILHAFKENKYTLGIFIDLSKAFDTVNHDILLKKLEMYGIKGNNLKWFCSYLEHRKQFIKFDNQHTNFEVLQCGVPQGSILGPLLFLVFVNDLKNSTKLLEPIMFADDTNLFYTNNNIKTLFEIANLELQNVNEWFIANKLSLNAEKTKYLFFHKQRVIENIPLKLPNLTFNGVEIKRESSIKFLGVMIDENITWRKHIELVENKMSKLIGILYRASPYLDRKSLKSIYFSFIHSYVNYCNIAWASTAKTKLSSILKKQKHAVRIVYNKDKFTHSRPLMRDMNVLNVYQINIFQTLRFMYKTKNNSNPRIFDKMFREIHHKYPTRFSRNNFEQPRIITKTTSFAISSRGAKIWNSYLGEHEKMILSLPLFLSKLKKKLLESEDELTFF